jgi:hypothetical protein
MAGDGDTPTLIHYHNLSNDVYAESNLVVEHSNPIGESASYLKGD